MHKKHAKVRIFFPSQFPFITGFRESAVDVLLGGKLDWTHRAGSSPADPGARPARRGPSWSSHCGWRSRLGSTLKPSNLGADGVLGRVQGSHEAPHGSSSIQDRSERRRPDTRGGAAET